MILKRVEKQADGGLKTEWQLSEEQTTFLLNYAISSLLQLGLVEVLTEQMEEERQLPLLEDLDPELLYKA